MAVGKVAAHLCLTLIVKELKISVEHARVLTILNIIFCVVFLDGVINSFVFTYYLGYYVWLDKWAWYSIFVLGWMLSVIHKVYNLDIFSLYKFLFILIYFFNFTSLKVWSWVELCRLWEHCTLITKRSQLWTPKVQAINGSWHLLLVVLISAMGDGIPRLTPSLALCKHYTRMIFTIQHSL